MASTTRNMWKVVHDRKCGAIVVLSDLVENGTVSVFQKKNYYQLNQQPCTEKIWEALVIMHGKIHHENYKFWHFPSTITAGSHMQKHGCMFT